MSLRKFSNWVQNRLRRVRHSSTPEDSLPLVPNEQEAAVDPPSTPVPVQSEGDESEGPVADPLSPESEDSDLIDFEPAPSVGRAEFCSRHSRRDPRSPLPSVPTPYFLHPDSPPPPYFPRRRLRVTTGPSISAPGQFVHFDCVADLSRVTERTETSQAPETSSDEEGGAGAAGPFRDLAQFLTEDEQVIHELRMRRLEGLARRAQGLPAEEGEEGASSDSSDPLFVTARSHLSSSDEDEAEGGQMSSSLAKPSDR